MKRIIPKTDKQPDLLWEVGEFARTQTLTFHFPLPFLMLCNLAEITPRQLIKDVIDNLAHASWKREGREEVKKLLVDYFIAHGYGLRYYSAEGIKMIFQEMDAVGMLFPQNKPALADLYSQWRDQHQICWFKKWLIKNNRT